MCLYFCARTFEVVEEVDFVTISGESSLFSRLEDAEPFCRGSIMRAVAEASTQGVKRSSNEFEDMGSSSIANCET